MTMSAGNGPDTQADANGYLQRPSLLTYLDVDAETSKSTTLSTVRTHWRIFLATENMSPSQVSSKAETEFTQAQFQWD